MDKLTLFQLRNQAIVLVRRLWRGFVLGSSPVRRARCGHLYVLAKERLDRRERMLDAALVTFE